jgi:hypothetical protein
MSRIYGFGRKMFNRLVGQCASCIEEPACDCKGEVNRFCFFLRSSPINATQNISNTLEYLKDWGYVASVKRSGEFECRLGVCNTKSEFRIHDDSIEIISIKCP